MSEFEDGKIPDCDLDNPEHKLIWNHLAFCIDEEDFGAIQLALNEREDEHEAIYNSSRVFVPFGNAADGRYQPRHLSEHVKDGAHRYVDWDCALKIWMILSKYAHISK